MNGDSKKPDFAYDDLPDASAYIRLLEVNFAQVRGRIECRVSPWAFAKAPPYTAISYTWGDPADNTEIDVNGARMNIRSNCAYVLCQASWHGPGYYWVDAICINQASDSEKSHQVQRMGDIFRAATVVLACVGRVSPSDDNTKAHFFDSQRM